MMTELRQLDRLKEVLLRQRSVLEDLLAFANIRQSRKPRPKARVRFPEAASPGLLHWHFALIGDLGLVVERQRSAIFGRLFVHLLWAPKTGSLGEDVQGAAHPALVVGGEGAVRVDGESLGGLPYREGVSVNVWCRHIGLGTEKKRGRRGLLLVIEDAWGNVQ
jgi:hypothetical protein